MLLFVCRGCLHCVVWFSYWFDNVGFISEGNTYRRYAASSLPLWGNTNIASSDIKASSETYGPWSIFHHISSRSTILQSFTFLSINQKYKKYLLYRLFSFIYLYQISLLQVTMKGLATTLLRWVQVV